MDRKTGPCIKKGKKSDNQTDKTNRQNGRTDEQANQTNSEIRKTVKSEKQTNQTNGEIRKTDKSDKQKKYRTIDNPSIKKKLQTIPY